MKVTTKIQYGIRLMINLGLRYGSGPVLLKEVAQEEGISLKYLSQIIIPLKAEGFVQSFRGAQGGYSLVKEPKDVLFREIMECLEGDFHLISVPAADGMRPSQEAAQKVWKKVETSISRTLEKITLEELIREARENQEKTIMYNI